MKARIVSGDERQVMSVLRGEMGWWRPWISCFWMRGIEVGCVSVEVIRMVTAAASLSGEGVRDGTFGTCVVAVMIVEI